MRSLGTEVASWAGNRLRVVGYAVIPRRTGRTCRDLGASRQRIYHTRRTNSRCQGSLRTVVPRRTGTIRRRTAARRRGTHTPRHTVISSLTLGGNSPVHTVGPSGTGTTRCRSCQSQSGGVVRAQGTEESVTAAQRTVLVGRTLDCGGSGCCVADEPSCAVTAD